MPASEYTFDWEGCLTPKMKKRYDEHGFLILRKFFDAEEVAEMIKTVTHPDGILKHSFTTPDGNDKNIRWTLCMQPGNDVTGMVARSEKMVDTCEELLGEEVYHWCSLYVLKDARNSGENYWHQDYGYWYNDGCLYPDMITLWTPLDPCNRTNSCKQVLKGSHKMGRLEHGDLENGQSGANPERVEKIKEQCEHVYLEMEPGDLFLHHGNTLHKSDANTSNLRRWAFMSCYNTARNSPVTETQYPSYTKLEKVSNDAIKTCKNYTDFSGKCFSTIL